MKLINSLILSAALVLPVSASAALYTFEENNANSGGGWGDKLDSLSTSYNDNTEMFTWDTTFNNSTDVDGFWLVVNAGGNPKGVTNELAIIYGDLTNNIWTSYLYNGANSSNSWAVNTYLESGTFDSITSNSFSLSIAASYINSQATKGIAFDDQLGAWFHVSGGSNFTYAANGEITGYSYANQGWYDKGYLDTTKVPEPSIVALLGLGLFGLGLTRRFKQK